MQVLINCDCEYRTNRKAYITRQVEVFIQSILCMSIMDRVLTSFTDQFNADGAFNVEDDTDVDLSGKSPKSEEKGLAALSSIRTFIDNLQHVLFDTLFADCREVINSVLI